MYSRRTVRPALGGGNVPSERPTLPPDYAGIAFRAPEERTIQDYPETLIPPAIERREESVHPDEAPLTHIEESEIGDSLFSPDENSMSDAAYSRSASYLAIEEPNELPNNEIEGESPPHDRPIALSHEQESSDPPPSASTDSDDSPLDWLETLKMEDMLLFWMLFRLLYGESREELDLLLCLLLFAR